MLCFRGVKIFPASEYYKLLYYAWVTFGFPKDFFLARASTRRRKAFTTRHISCQKSIA